MVNLRPILLVVGLLLAMLGGFMMLPLMADLTMPDSTRRENWKAFAISGAFCMFLGGNLAMVNWGKVGYLGAREGFMISAFSWLTLAFASALPFMFGHLSMSPTDAIFEAMSGITTTGATVIEGLDDAPLGLLLWRSILQWFGGIGIVIMAIAIMPMLSIGGMQLFKIESADTGSDKVLPGTSQLAAAITGFYVFFTALCFLMYWSMGMNSFDAINHAMTTIATGGFSTKDASFGYFLTDENIRGPIDLVCVMFMLIGSLPFGLYLLMSRGHLTALFKDSQARFFLGAVAVFVTIIMLRVLSVYEFDLFHAFRMSSFNVVSIMTGTGYASTDYGLWGPFAFGFFFCIMFVGGCAGSTSCGLKVFRIQIVLSALSLYGKRLAYPNGVFVARYNGRPLTTDIFISVLSYFFVYFAGFATTAVALSFFDLDPLTALSAAGSAVANVGPGLGEVVGPAGNYRPLPDGAKWVLTAAMLFGRLEFFTLLVMLSPSFWRG